MFARYLIILLIQKKKIKRRLIMLTLNKIIIIYSIT